MDALSSEIGYLINVNSVVQILKRRILLANIDIAYSVSTDSLQATEGWISRLQLSAASPDFTLLLRNASGYPDITILSTNIVNIAPTGSPTLSPLSTAGKYTNFSFT